MLHDIPDARIAIGATAPGIEGFRRSHRDALTTARMIIRLESPHRVAFSPTSRWSRCSPKTPRVPTTSSNAPRKPRVGQPGSENDAIDLHQPAVQRFSGRETSLHPPQHLDEPTRDRATTSAPPSRRHHHSRRRRTRSPAVAGEANQRSSGKERVEWHQDALARQRSTDRYATAAARPSRPSCEPPGPDGRARRRPAGNVRRPPR